MNATLLVAVLGVVLSVASLVWQFANFILSGPRVRVRLLLGIANDDLSSVKSWSGEAPTSSTDIIDERLQSPTRELAIVEIRNVVRAAVSIVSIGLATERRRFFMNDLHATGVDVDKVRLDPGDRHTSQTDLWPLIDELRATRQGEAFPVYAMAELGNGHCLLSPRKNAWQLSANLRSIMPGASDDYEPPNRSGGGPGVRFAGRYRRRG